MYRKLSKSFYILLFFEIAFISAENPLSVMPLHPRLRSKVSKVSFESTYAVKYFALWSVTLLSQNPNFRSFITVLVLKAWTNDLTPLSVTLHRENSKCTRNSFGC